MLLCEGPRGDDTLYLHIHAITKLSLAFSILLNNDCFGSSGVLPLQTRSGSPCMLAELAGDYGLSPAGLWTAVSPLWSEPPGPQQRWPFALGGTFHWEYLHGHFPTQFMQVLESPIFLAQPRTCSCCSWRTAWEGYVVEWVGDKPVEDQE